MRKYRLEKENDVQFVYLELPQLMTYGFSYAYFYDKKNSEYHLSSKKWNAEYDHSRYDKGIYNIDRLAIIKSEVILNIKQTEFLNSISCKNNATKEPKGIILDGIFCELKIFNPPKTFNWNVDYQMNKDLKQLINFIKNIKS